MYDLLAPLNFILWIGITIIYFVGNLTYADYYTKLAHDTRQMFNMIIGVQAGCFLANFMLVALVEQSIYKGFRYGLGWCTGLSLFIYAVGIGFGVYYGFGELKKYFGKKRGKL